MVGREISIVFNGFSRRVPGDTTILDLIESVGENDRHVVVERNNRFVFKQDYSSTRLRDGDKVEFINPDFGG